MILDIALIALYLIIVLIYVKRGFVKSIWGLVRLVVSVIAAYMFGGLLGEWMNETFILSAITKTTYNTLNPMLVRNNGAANISELFSVFPEGFKSVIERCGADLEVLAKKFGDVTRATEADVMELSKKISEPISESISKAAGYVVVFVAAFVILIVVGKIIMLFAEIPGIDKVNELLGGVLGVAAGLIYIWVVCLFLSILVENSVAQETGEAFRRISSESWIFRFFCSISPLDFINIKSL